MIHDTVYQMYLTMRMLFAIYFNEKENEIMIFLLRILASYQLNTFP